MSTVKKKKKTGEKYRPYICSDLVSSGTLLLRTQLSCSWTDSGVVGPSPVPGAGAWMGLRPPLRVFLFRLLADWWDKVWWLCGGGSGGRSVDWLWWLAAPGRRQEQREKLKRHTSLWMTSKTVSDEAREREHGISFQNAANPNVGSALFDSCLFPGVPKKLNPSFQLANNFINIPLWATFMLPIIFSVGVGVIFSEWSITSFTKGIPA